MQVDRDMPASWFSSNTSICLLVIVFTAVTPLQNATPQGAHTPVWSKADLDSSQVLVARLTPNPSYLWDYEAQSDSRPPFYSGPMPLSVKAAVIIGPSTSSSPYKATLYHDFGAFRNTFLFLPTPEAQRLSPLPSLAPAGARTTDSSGRLVAEARLIGTGAASKGMLDEIMIEEFHYGADGSTVFTCKTAVDNWKGVKIRELDAKGTKLRDYYFVWPTPGVGQGGFVGRATTRPSKRLPQP